MAGAHTLVRDLHRRRGRERRGLTLAEGVRLVEEVLEARVVIRHAFVAPGLDETPRGVALRARLETSGAPVESVSDEELTELAATDRPQGVMAVIVPPAWTIDQIFQKPEALAVVLDGVQDPGNVGTIVRTAWALGASGVVALPGTAELTNPKTLRATMGGLFRLPSVAVGQEDADRAFERHRVQLAAAEVGGADLAAVRLASPAALVVGNEGAGVGAWLADRAQVRVGIPIRSDAESLNVAVATGILLYGLLRDR